MLKAFTQRCEKSSTWIQKHWFMFNYSTNRMPCTNSTVLYGLTDLFHSLFVLVCNAKDKNKGAYKVWAREKKLSHLTNQLVVKFYYKSICWWHSASHSDSHPFARCWLSVKSLSLLSLTLPLISIHFVWYRKMSVLIVLIIPFICNKQPKTATAPETVFFVLVAVESKCSVARLILYVAYTPHSVCNIQWYKVINSNEWLPCLE